MARSAKLYAAVVAAAMAALLLTHRLVSPRGRLFVVTPTRDDLTRYAHLLYTAHALAHSSSARSVEWVLLEDGEELDPSIAHLLKASGVKHHYVVAPSGLKSAHRGITQRNAALELIKQTGREGVVYFADDDNAYRPSLWHHLLAIANRRNTYTIFPVGNTGFYAHEGPVFVDAEQGDGKQAIQQWCCDYCVRRWNVDMSGFAFHTSLLHEEATSSILFDPASASGFLENDILTRIEHIKSSSLVILPDLLDEIHVWHNFGSPFSKAAFYDPDWTTHASLSHKMHNKTDSVDTML
ncbi:hypothetical protein JCM8547_005044 [Rhodosporidiobolus lusitaniae]